MTSRGSNIMKSFVFALSAVASLALAGCNSGDQDAVDNSALNQAADIDALANDAANDAANAEAEALGAQQNQLEQENAVEDNTANPVDEDEQNVSGM